MKLSGSVAELRKNIGDDVIEDEVLAILESREVADAKSKYLAAKLSNELQQISRRATSRYGRAVRSLSSSTSSRATRRRRPRWRFGIARQKLMALGVQNTEIAGLPQAPDGTLGSQNIRAPISGRVAERKVELGTAIGRDNSRPSFSLSSI